MNEKDKYAEIVKRVEYCFPICPKCGSIDVDYSQFDMDADEVWQVASCNKCGMKWNEVYRFVFCEYDADITLDCEVGEEK